MRQYDRGHPEKPQRCVVEVSEPPHYLHSHQCGRERGHGDGALLCKQHAKMQAAGRYLRIPKDFATLTNSETE